jgi:hypothetical protein
MTLARAEELAQARHLARAERNFALADELRDAITQCGYSVMDTPDGWQLAELPQFVVHESARMDGSPLGVGAQALVTLLVDGWREDAAACVAALLEHEPINIHLVVVDIGNRDGVGEWLDELARENPQRVTAIHVTAQAHHWGQLHRDVISRCAASFYAVIDMSSQISGPTISVCCDALNANSQAVAAGWRGAQVSTADEWRSVTAAAGNVDVLLSYLMVVRTAAAQQTPPDDKARFYRNADIEWSLALRDTFFSEQGRPAELIALDDALPVTQGRHHGYHDSTPDERDRESRRNYDRILKRWRGRTEILHTS